MRLVDGKLSKDDETAIEELHQYLIEGEGSWALGDGFLLFVGRILEDKNLSTEARVHLLRTLAAAALKDDIILLLHQDRRDHIIMNFAQDIDRKSPEEQEGIALFVCNKQIIRSITEKNHRFYCCFRCAIYLRIQVHLNGCCIYQNGRIIINKLQIFVLPLKLLCIVS